MFKGLCTLLALVATVLPAVASEGPAEHATGRRWRAPALQAPNLTPELYEATLRAAQHSSHLQPQRRSAAEATRRPFKVHFDYSQLRPDTNATDRDYLQNKLVPSLGAVLKQFLQVRKPVVGNLRLFPTCSTSNNSTENGSPCLEYNTTCQGVFDIPNEHLAPFGNNPGGPGVDADLIIYVSNDPELACGNTTLAAAGPCLQDLETDRPTAGIINYCTFGPDNFVADLEVSVHEVFHVLGFNPDFFERPDSVFRGFRDDNGARLRGSEIAANFTERGGTVSKIILPRVMAAARAHFGCPTLNGAELEDDGGGGTAAGHWEERVFDGELMCGSSLPLPTPSARSMLTNVTLALLEDTGWYAVNYAGSTNRFGHQAGCLLPTATCQDILASSDEAAKRFFCTDDESETEPRCTADLSGIGTCVEQPTWDGCKRVQVGTDGDCIVNDGTIGGPRGPGGRCVPTLTGSSRSAICSAMSCSGPSLVLQLTAGSTEVAPFECPSGQTLETGLVSVSIKQPIQAVCPDTALMCATTGPSNNVGYLICPNDCSAQGRCQRGVCQCFLGFVGPDCSSPICMTDADCMGGTSCHWNGQCLAGDDSVQQFPITSGGLDTGRAPSPTTSSGSSPSDSSATDSTRDSSASVLACTRSLAAGLAVVLAAILL